MTGATGAIGPALVRFLLSEGWAVRSLTRGNTLLLPSEVQIVSGNISDVEAAKAATVGADVVFHLAAKLHINNPSPEMESEYYKTNVRGTENLLLAARNSHVQRFVFFSTINVYGSTCPGEFVNELSPPRLYSYYARTKYEAEQLVINSGIPSVVLRLAAVYGHGMKGNYLRLMEVLRKHRFVYVGGGGNRRTLVHLQDVCIAAELAALHPQAIGQIFNVTDGEIHTLREIVTSICVALGINPPWLRVPVWPVRVSAGIIENACKLIGKSAFVSPSMIDKLTEDVAVRGEKIQRDLGFKASFNLALGWKDVVRASLPAQITPNCGITVGIVNGGPGVDRK